jgi:hypothetical protein
MLVTCDCEAGQISLSQERNVQKILECYGKTDVHPISTPTLANEHLHKLTEPEIDVKSYQHMASVLMYPMLGTCPDLAYAVGALGQHSANPREEHQCTLDRVFRYLRATASTSLVFCRGSPGSLTLYGYTDADWASNVNDCKSTSSFIFMLAGAAISWSSKKQASTALSSTKAEYIATMHAAKELVWLLHLLNELGQVQKSPMLLRIDNQSAMAVAKNPEFHDRTKHIEVHYHFLCQLVDKRALVLEYVPTNSQIADVLTKGLVREKHERFATEMGLEEKKPETEG